MIVLLHELEVFIERNTTAVVSIDLVEIPLHHFFSDWDLQGLEGVLHQSPELMNVDQIIFILVLGVDCPLSEKVPKLNKIVYTYSSKVIFPSPF